MCDLGCRIFLALPNLKLFVGRMSLTMVSTESAMTDLFYMLL